jgi:cellulose synthase (UDP-forming)
MPEYHIITKIGLLPTVAFWAGINVLVLFLVCMMSLQVPIRRNEERFEIEEPIWILNANGSIFTGCVKDLSLSGVGIIPDAARPMKTSVGERVRLYIAEVGFVGGIVVRSDDCFLGVHFSLPSSVERDLLIRKLFTGNLDPTHVSASAWSATGALLKTIWVKRTEQPTSNNMIECEMASKERDKLPAESLVITPGLTPSRLSQLGSERRKLAA